MAGRPTKLNENARFRALRLLERKPNVSQRELAEEIGISVGSANYVVRALIEKGLVKVANFKAAEDKRRYSYILTPKGLAEKAALTGRFLVRRVEEYEALREEIEELRSEDRLRSGEGSEASSVDEGGGR